MNIRDKKDAQKTKDKKPQVRLKSVQSKASVPNMRPSLADSYNKNNTRPQIISGYFVDDKPYKEVVISRVNSSLCLVLAALVVICIVSYYFAIMSEIELNKIGKETLALNYENEEIQNELDRRQSYNNVDRAVSATNSLKRASRIMEIPVRNISEVNYREKKRNYIPTWTLGF